MFKMQTLQEFIKLNENDRETSFDFKIKNFARKLDNDKLLSMYDRSLAELCKLQTTESCKTVIEDLLVYIKEIERRDITKIK